VLIRLLRWARATPALLLALLLASPGAQATEKLKISDSHGAIDFAIGNSKVFRTTGTFKDWQGTVNVDDADVPKSAVEVVVNTASIQMLDSQQTAMLRDSDFFDVGRFPKMTFHSTRIERTSNNSLKVEGDMMLRGITRPMTFDVTVSERRAEAPPGSRYARFRGLGTIKRSEFGMTKYSDMLGDTVEISIATEAWR
jgi:polyisoprenoid-binding protein YceI